MWSDEGRRRGESARRGGREFASLDRLWTKGGADTFCRSKTLLLYAFPRNDEFQRLEWMEPLYILKLRSLCFQPFARASIDRFEQRKTGRERQGFKFKPPFKPLLRQV